ncbi:shikimate dehydrogenase [Rhizobium sp. CRIBSB]|nr:shikimate dehydrogenase [Rhizobium sp. CRIBSB]
MADTRVVHAGLIGSGIQASLTPAMHMREGAAQGLAYTYEKLDLDLLPDGAAALAALLREAEDSGLDGLNITHPCKQTVIGLLDEVDEDVQALGACNTVVLTGGRRIGRNTDWWGFAESFRRGLPGASLAQVVQMGAGGAGSAVAYALLTLGAGKVEIFDLDQAKARELVDRLAPRFGRDRIVAGRDIAAAMATADGLAQCTAVGMAKYPGTPLDVTLLQPHQWVAEVIYFPLETALLKAARERGCAVLDGGGMAVLQAVKAFEHFTGLMADTERMRAHFGELVAATA